MAKLRSLRTLDFGNLIRREWAQAKSDAQETETRICGAIVLILWIVDVTWLVIR